ncbi:terminal uridylyltransferase 7 isoform X1 [Bufo bufo]|uniref:terminal uridylyltransferase 7 isoform X1 n=1 Tax=Bufo bufo TaxID=8384 RepID=UPI001ABEE44A|nr:terminal uridylyltransferase 7 isoform X1 [Bufo bufo]
MGDAANQVRGKGLKEEDDFKRSPKKPSYLSPECQGKKLGRDSSNPKAIPVVYGRRPRNGPHQNFSPVMQAGNSPKDPVKRWSAEEQRSDSDNWRGRQPPNVNRSRNNSTNESGDSTRWQEVGDRHNQMGRRQSHKETAPGDLSDHHGISDLQTPIKRERQYSRSERDEEDCLGSPVIDESMLSKKELLGLQQAEERLKRDCIYRLKRRPRKYPTAIYTCKLCDALVDSIPSAHKHMKEKRHRRILKEKREEELLTTLPPPTQPQIQAIGIAISKVVQERGLNEDDVAKRLSTVSSMESVIKEKLPGCSLRLYGSSCNRMGFKNSDLNIDIQFPVTMNQPDVLLLVQESLIQSDLFTDFEADFHARVPVVVCREKKSDLICKCERVAMKCLSHHQPSGCLGPKRVKACTLVVAFRYWAKLCGIDRPEEGGLPPYVAALLVVFFLQQRKEPVLPTYLGSWIDGFTISKLAQFSLKEPNNEYVFWEYSAVADNENQNNDRCTAKGKAPLFFDTEKLCSASVGQLWVELLRFYALEFNMVDLVVNVRVKEKLFRDLKDWPKKRIAIEDPYSVKRNVARSMNSQIVYEYLLHCLKATYKYFALPQNKSGKCSVKKSSSSTNANRGSTPSAVKCPNFVQNISKQLEDLTIDHHDGSGYPVIVQPSCSEVQSNLDSKVKKKLDYNITYPDVNLEDADCITEEIILDDSEDFFQGSEEPESPHEDTDDDHPLMGNEGQGDYITIDQSYEEDSESGDAAVPGNEETDSLSDFEGGIVTEGEEIGLESSDLYGEKVDLGEESTEGTDELEETIHDFGLAAVPNSDDEEEDDEESSLILIHREPSDILNDELENTYTGSVDELLPEDGQTGQVSVSSCKDHDETNEGLAGRVLQKTEVAKKPLPVSEGSAIEDVCLFYEFSRLTFTKGKLPTVVCNLCKKEGHLKKDCPEDFKKIELEPLPALTAKFRQLLDQVCIQCYEDFHPTSLEDKAREHIRHDLEDFIRREFKGARLSLFGSSKNGFGFKQSDLDICMTFEGLETAEELDSIRTIEELARQLRRHQGLRNILPITTAKVPIVKFYHVRSGLEGDISLYNTLALHNTRLLSSYAAIDPRVKYLCYIMKVFTKMCDIGDASRGSLSSYAYTLMVLYFLQQRNPPVIPVLQEIYTNGCKPEILVDGWSVYFFSQTEELAKYWPEFGKNKESVGELWVGLLRFYTEDFDFKEHVISIRKKSLLTTFKKQWTSKYIVIEDPFDLTHNLGAGLSRKMTNFIMKAFINGRRLFGTPVKGIPKEYPSKMEYFFDPELLTEGEVAPNDRCCRICGKIGHFMKDCPMRRKVRRRNNENQRYVDKRQQRKPEDKELNNSMEGDGFYMDGKQCTTPKKLYQGARSSLEACRERTPKHSSEKWRRQEELREKRCFICGREGHIKKECPQYKGAAGSPKSDAPFGSPSASSPLKHQGRFIQVVPSPDEKWKPKMSFSPQSGSLSTKYMTQGKASRKKAHQEF